MDVDIDDLFDVEPSEDVEDGDIGAQSDEDGHDSTNAENPDGEQKKTDDVDVDVGDGQPKRKRVLRPQPKLNADRLCGPRGIGVMEETFSKLTFKGRGHEREDLKLLMSKMEHWAHRLFPRMPFDNTLERIEKLGKSKPVQVNVKKVRMGMSLLPSVVDDDDEAGHGAPEVDVFDELIASGGTQQRQASPPTSPGPGGDGRASPQPSTSTRPSTSTSTGLTEEQLERMRKNRELAQLRRMRARFSQQQAGRQDEPRSQSPDQETEAPSQSEPQQAGLRRDGGSASPAARRPRGDAASPSVAGLSSAVPAPGPPREPAGAGSGPDSGDEGLSPLPSPLPSPPPSPPLSYCRSRVSEGDLLGSRPSGDTETSADRMGHLHQTSETGTLEDAGGEESNTAPVGNIHGVLETETVASIVDQETSASPMGHLHQMSETETLAIADDVIMESDDA